MMDNAFQPWKQDEDGWWRRRIYGCCFAPRSDCWATIISQGLWYSILIHIDGKYVYSIWYWLFGSFTLNGAKKKADKILRKRGFWFVDDERMKLLL